MHQRPASRTSAVICWLFSVQSFGLYSVVFMNYDRFGYCIFISMFKIGGDSSEVKWIEMMLNPLKCLRVWIFHIHMKCCWSFLHFRSFSQQGPSFGRHAGMGSGHHLQRQQPLFSSPHGRRNARTSEQLRQLHVRRLSVSQTTYLDFSFLWPWSLMEVCSLVLRLSRLLVDVRAVLTISGNRTVLSGLQDLSQAIQTLGERPDAWPSMMLIKCLIVEDQTHIWDVYLSISVVSQRHNFDEMGRERRLFLSF